MRVDESMHCCVSLLHNRVPLFPSALLAAAVSGVCVNKWQREEADVVCACCGAGWPHSTGRRDKSTQEVRGIDSHAASAITRGSPK